MSETWTPPPLTLADGPIFTAPELSRIQKDIFINRGTTRHDERSVFSESPKFLYMGRRPYIRHEVLLYRPDGKRLQLLDSFRGKYGNRFWDIVRSRIIELPLPALTMPFEFDPIYMRRMLQFTTPWPSDREIDPCIVETEAWRWVEQHHAQWNHEDWLSLLQRLRYFNWKIEPHELGQLLEAFKQTYVVISQSGLSISAPADVANFVSRALDYREFIDQSPKAQANFLGQGLFVYRPQVVVLVDTYGHDVSSEDAKQLDQLTDRMTSREAIEEYGYQEIHDFATKAAGQGLQSPENYVPSDSYPGGLNFTSSHEHYRSQKYTVTVATAFFCPDIISDVDPASGLSKKTIALLCQFFETRGFGHLSEDKSQPFTKELVASGLIDFFVWGENGVWGHDLTEKGCQIINMIYGLNLVGATDQSRAM